MCKKKRIWSLVLTFAMMVSLLSPSLFNVAAADITGGFTVTDIRLYTDLERTNPVSATNPVKENGSYCAAIDWSYSGAAIVSGDKVEIPYANESNTATTSDWQYGSVAWSDIYDASHNKLGRWHTTGSTANRKIIIEFSDTAVGKTALTGSLYSPKNLTPTYSYQDHAGIPMTIGGLTVQIPYVSYALGNSATNGYKFVGSASNNAIEWRIISPHSVINELWKTQGDGPLPTLSDVYFEDNIGHANVSWMSINARYLWPTTATPGEYAASHSGTYRDVTATQFTQITPNPSETYPAFKTRLTPMQYGYWDDGTGDKTLVINFGSLPSTTVKYEDCCGTDQLGTLLPPFMDATGVVADKMNKVYNNSNCVGGGVVLWAVRMNTTYPTVVTPTKYSNTATWSYSLNGTAKQDVSTASGTLTPANSLATAANTAQLVLLDADDKTPIQGAKLTLQKYDAVSDTWSNVAGAVDKITPDNGMVSVAGLSVGTYRWTQSTYTTGYTTGSFRQYSDSACSTSIASFEITATDGNTSFGTDTRQRFTVTYAPGDHGAFTTQTTSVPYGAPTPAFSGEKTGAAGYTFTDWNPSTIPLTVTANATYTAQWSYTESNISYVLNGGTAASGNPSKYIEGADTYAYADFKAPSKSGVAFGGWYTDNTFATKYPGITATTTGDQTLYAKWNPISDILYELDGGTAASGNPTTYGEGVNTYPYASFKAPTKAQYDFDGWYTDNTFATKYPGITLTTTGTQTLYAKWTPHVAKINYVLDGGVNAATNPTTYTEGVDSLTYYSFQSATKTGFAFGGWYTDNTFTTRYPGITLTTTGDQTLYAKWGTSSSGGGSTGSSSSPSKQYTLTFQPNGGSAVNSITVAAGTVLTVDQTTTRDDYVFDGWYSDSALTQKVTSITMNSNHTVYAKWTEKKDTDITWSTQDHFAYIIGYPEGDVRPAGNITRAEVATIFFRLLTDSSRKSVWSTDNTFSDVAEAQWFNNAVSTMAKAGFVTGYNADSFGPSRPITRAEFAAIAVRANGGDTTTTETAAFPDATNHWATGYIAQAVRMNLITGYQDGTFKPDQPITRAEAMAIVNRFLGRDKVDSTSLITNMVDWSDNADTGAWYYYDVQEATNSHDYTRQGDNVEQWTKINDVRDWAALETAWATANS